MVSGRILIILQSELTFFPRKFLYLSFLSNRATVKVVSASMRDHSAVLGWLQMRNPRGKEGVALWDSVLSLPNINIMVVIVSPLPVM